MNRSCTADTLLSSVVNENLIIALSVIWAIIKNETARSNRLLVCSMTRNNI